MSDLSRTTKSELIKEISVLKQKIMELELLETEHRCTGEALHRSEIKFHTLYDSISDAVMLINEKDFLDCNKAALAISGCATREEFCSLHPEDLSPTVQPCGTDSITLSKRHIAAALEKGRHQFEWVHKRVDTGESFPADVLLIAMVLDGKQVLLAVARDITDRKRVEEALLNSEQHFKDLSEESIAGVYLLQDGIFKYANSKLAQILGYELDEIIDKLAVKDVVFPEDWPIVEENMRKRISGGLKSIHYEFRVITKNKEIRNSEVFSSRTMYRGEPAIIGTHLDITDRKQMEEKLKESEKTLRSLINATDDALLLIDTKGTILVANETLAKRMGKDSQEIIGIVQYDLFPSDVAERRKEKYDQVVHTGKSVYFEDTRNGRVYETSAYPVFDDRGCVSKIAIFPKDITNRKQAESKQEAALEALKKQESLIRVITNSAQDAILMMDTKGCISFWNPAAEHIFGYTDEEAIGSNLHQFLAPRRFMEAHLTAFEMFKDTGRGKAIDKVIELQGCRKNGEEFPIEVSLSSIQLEDGWHAVGIVRDITERKQVEEELRESRRRLSDIIEFLPDATLVIDKEGRVIAWNRALEDMTGVRKEDMLGKGNYEYSIPFYGDRRPILVDLALHRDREMEKQYTTIHRVGEILFGDAYTPNMPGGNLYLSGTASVLRDSRGEIIAAIECIRDNTERRRMAEALQETNINLERAIERANEMAIQAQMANKAKSEFLANMSHEIRTPMNGVIGMTGLLLDTKLTDEQQRFAEIVRASAESLLGLVNDILDFSKIEAGMLGLEIIDFDLLSLIEDFAATMAVRAHDKGLELLYAFTPQVPVLLRGDPGRLRQILTNLVGNAVKFTHTGEVVIRVMVESDIEDTVVLRFSVRDTGIGIPRDKIGLLFNKFSQADTSTTRKYGGTGLGLAISKQLAELMGGEIGVDSEEDKGSEFWFTVSLGKQPEGMHTGILPSADLTGIRILIVDDNATNREILMTRMTNWGMRPFECKDGIEALQALRQAVYENDPFRITIIDMQMPGVDGESLGRSIKADNRLADIRMVMLTSLGIRGDACRFQNVGFAAYLTKPVRYQELKNVLSMILSDRDLTRKESEPIVTRHSTFDMLPLFTGNKARVLLAEDNITNQHVALGILNKLGLRADAVANGAEVLKVLESIPYDLILMDVQMPVMDGMEATRQIRNPQSAVLNHAIPIIAMTAHAMQGDREKCLEAGMDDYVSKPVTPQTLAERLEKWLTKDPGKRERIKYEQRPEKTKEPQTAEPIIWDKAGMLERLMDDEELTKKITDGFLTDIPQQIQALKTFLEAGSVSDVERQAHTIKGAAANIGGERLRAVAFEMEKEARDGDLTAVNMSVANLVTQFEQLKKVMVKEC
ncbi:MAG: PAS domain S-box protein [Proteobacteria bacterium]|nr:PAS domain S-box protein [Pseudomonadota bacterium]